MEPRGARKEERRGNDARAKGKKRRRRANAVYGGTEREEVDPEEGVGTVTMMDESEILCPFAFWAAAMNGPRHNHGRYRRQNTGLLHQCIN